MLKVHVPEDHGATEVLHESETGAVVRPRRWPGDTYPSLWFTFRVDADARGLSHGQLEIRELKTGAETYEPFWKHCLWSEDGRDWERIPGGAQRFGETTLTVTLSLPPGGSRWIAATYPLPLAHYDALDRKLSLPPAAGLRVTRGTYGTTTRGRPLLAYRIEREDRRPERALLIVAGQHAVEQSGKIFAEVALRGYHGGAFAGTPMAGVLERYAVVILPLANPDGCFDGRMNSNATGTVMDTADDDSPEMRAALALLEEARPVAVVNCHGWGNEWGAPPYEDLYRWSDDDPLFAYLKEHLPGCCTSAGPHYLEDRFRLENEARARFRAECVITELNWNRYVPPGGAPPVRPTRAQIEERAGEYLTAIARYLTE